MTEMKHPSGLVLQAYHDGELESSAAAEVKAHCNTCDECRNELAELGRMDMMLAGVPEPAPPRPMWNRVRPGRVREPRLRPVFGFAACAAGVVLGVLMGPIEFDAGGVETESAWSNSVSVWNSGASASVLNVFQVEQE